MKKFLKKLILFSIIPLITVLVFDFWLRNINTSYSEKYNGLITAKDSVGVLFLGNSHANYGIDPTVFSNYYAYNLANVNQMLYFDKRITEKAIQEGVENLKYVFISIDYHSLYASGEDQREIWSYYANGVKHEDRNYFLADLSPFFWGYTPKVSYALLKKSIKLKGLKMVALDVESGVNITDTMKQGFLGYTGQNKNGFTTEKFKNRANYFEEPKDSNREEIIQDLKDFIATLKEHNINPILFSSPTYSVYNQYLDTNVTNRNMTDLAEISQVYNIQYWDYINSDKFSSDDFYDGDHLNKEGAKKFTKMLSDRLKEYENTN